MEVIAFFVEMFLHILANSKNKWAKAFVVLTSGFLLIALCAFFVVLFIHSYRNDYYLMMIIMLILICCLFGFIVYSMIEIQRQIESTRHNIS